MRDLYNRVKLVDRFIEPQTQTNLDTAIVSQIVDRAGYEQVLFAIALGTLTDANATVSVKIEEGAAANLSDAANVATTDLQLENGTGRMATTPAANHQVAFDFSADLKTFKIGYIGMKRYLRVTVTPSGNDAGAIPIAVTCILGGARHQPAGATQFP